MPKLTKDLIDSLPCPPRGQSILRDEDLPGFGLRLTPTCKAFIVESEVNGVRRRVTLGRWGSINLESARIKAKQVLGKMASGVDIVAQRKAHGPSVLEVLNDFLADRRMKPDTKVSYRQRLTLLLPDWLDLLNNKPRYKTSAAEAKLWKEEIWSKTDMDDIWTNRPKVGAW